MESGLSVIWKTLDNLRQWIAKDDEEFIESCKVIEERRIVTEKPNAQELVLMTRRR